MPLSFSTTHHQWSQHKSRERGEESREYALFFSSLKKPTQRIEEKPRMSTKSIKPKSGISVCSQSRHRALLVVPSLPSPPSSLSPPLFSKWGQQLVLLSQPSPSHCFSFFIWIFHCPPACPLPVLPATALFTRPETIHYYLYIFEEIFFIYKR